MTTSNYYYDQNQVMDSIDDTNLLLMIKEPFYAHLFSGLNREIRMDIPTACIAFHPASNFLGLWVNPEFWNEKLKGVNNTETNNFRFGVIKHEILHIVYKHIFRGAEFQDKRLFNIAADIVINQQIDASQLIAGACTLSQFPDFNLKSNETSEYYYNTLKKEEDKMKSQTTPKNKSQENLEKFLNRQDHGHENWSELAEEFAGTEDLINSKIEAQLQEIANKLKNTNHWGSLPGFIRDYIEDMTAHKKQVVNWKHVLRKFTASSSSSSITNTIRRPSKRFGTTPGTKIIKKQRILVAIDTSGSVDNLSLAEFFAEIRHIYKNGAHIRIVECDTQIHAEYDYKGYPPATITGRGGTDFTAPFIYAQTYHPDAIIYFTDGYCTVPQVKVRTNKVMWIICKNGGIDVDDFKRQGFPGMSLKM